MDGCKLASQNCTCWDILVYNGPGLLKKRVSLTRYKDERVSGMFQYFSFKFRITCWYNQGDKLISWTLHRSRRGVRNGAQGQSGIRRASNERGRAYLIYAVRLNIVFLLIRLVFDMFMQKQIMSLREYRNVYICLTVNTYKHFN